MKHFIKFITVLATFAILLSAIAVPSFASTYQTSGLRTINPTNAQFRAAKNPKYTRLIETITDNISQAYETHIYHYVAPTSGQYLIFTEGSTDTVGNVYQDTLFQWKPLSANPIDDVPNTFRSTSNNFYIAADLKAGEDYYIVIRGYSTCTGSYTLHIEPYRDKAVSNCGGFWHNYYRQPMTAGVKSVEYLTAEQCAEIYNFISNQTIQNLIDNYWISVGSKGVLMECVKNHLTLLSAFDTMGLFSEIPGVSQVIGISSIIIDSIIEDMYKDTGKSVKLLSQIQECCGLTRTTASSYINGRYASGTFYSCQYGLRIQNNIKIDSTQIYAPSYGGWVIFNKEKEYVESYMRYCDTAIFGGDFVHGGWIVDDCIFFGNLTITAP